MSLRCCDPQLFWLRPCPSILDIPGRVFRMAESPPSRPRSNLSAEDLAKLLEPIALEGGKSFLKYDEAESVDKSKCDTKLIAKYIHVAVAIRSDDVNSLLLTKSAAKGACDILFDKIAKSWGMDVGWKTDWVLTMTHRLRNFCSAINAGEKKAAPPSWVKALPWWTPKPDPSQSPKSPCGTPEAKSGKIAAAATQERGLF